MEHLEGEGDIGQNLLPCVAAILEPLDMQQQHLGQAVQPQPLSGACSLAAHLALEGLVPLMTKQK